MTIALSFDANYYLTARPDVFNAFVATAGATGLTWAAFAESHYNTFGRFEGSNPNSVFNTTEYLTANPDVAAAGVNPFQHFLSNGITEGRAPNASLVGSTSFDSAAYLAANTDLGAAGITTAEAAYAHYLEFGQFEGRPGTPDVVATPGSTFTLTTSIDNLTGTTGDDTFIGDSTTGLVSPGDVLDGGAGTDTLQLFSTNTLPRLVSVENLYLNGDAATDASTDFSGANQASVTSIELDTGVVGGGDQTLTFGNGQSLTLDSIQGDGAGVANSQYDIATNSAATSFGLTLDGVGTTAILALDFDIAQLATLNVTASGAASSVSIDNAGGGLKTVNVAGDKNVMLDFDTDATAITTLNAATATGNVSSLFTNDTITATGGAGDDSFDFVNNGALSTTTATIDGGAGTDTVKTDAITDVDGTYSQITNVEALTINTVVAASDTLSATAITGLETITLTGGVAVGQTATISNIASTGFTLVSTVSGGDGTIDLNVDGASTNTADSISVELNASTAAGGNTLAALDITDVETLNLVSDDTDGNADGTLDDSTADGSTITSLLADDLTTLNISGDGDLVITGSNSTKLATIAAGASTGSLNLTGISTASGVSITTGSGNDQVTGSTGTDTIMTGAGNDTVNFNVSNNSGSTVDAGTQSATGADTLNLTGAFAGASGVVVDLTAADQIVSIFGTANAAVQSGFENVDASAMTAGTGTAGVTITGTDGNNTLTGSVLGDAISGGAGVDIINGGAGADTITLGAGSDTVIFANEGTSDTVTDFATGTGGDLIQIDVSAFNSDNLSDSTGTKLTAATATNIAEYTVGAALAVDTAGTSIIKVSNTTGINSFADVSTAIDANNITLDSGGTDFAIGEGIMLAFYDADDAKMVVGYMESDAADVFDDGNTFVEVASLGMSVASYNDLSAGHFDFI